MAVCSSFSCHDNQRYEFRLWQHLPTAASVWHFPPVIHTDISSSFVIHQSQFITIRYITYANFDVLLTVHFSIFILVINQLDAQNFCFTISLFRNLYMFRAHVLETCRGYEMNLL